MSHVSIPNWQLIETLKATRLRAVSVQVDLVFMVIIFSISQRLTLLPAILLAAGIQVVLLGKVKLLKNSELHCIETELFFFGGRSCSHVLNMILDDWWDLTNMVLDQYPEIG